MKQYIFATSVIFWAVELLLLIGAESLCGYPPRLARIFPASFLGGLYAALCLFPGLHFLGGFLWRVLVMLLICLLSFGTGRSAIRRWLVFGVLTLALHGIISVSEAGGSRWLVLGALGLCGICRILLRGRTLEKTYVPVVLTRNGETRTLTALMDTGNTLTDPITGQRVLLADAKLGREMLGLTQEELADPITTFQKRTVPGMRLIPYRAVGQPSGMLLAVKMDEVWIRGSKADPLVAFAPDRIGAGEGYEALAGGIV